MKKYSTWIATSLLVLTACSTDSDSNAALPELAASDKPVVFFDGFDTFQDLYWTRGSVFPGGQFCGHNGGLIRDDMAFTVDGVMNIFTMPIAPTPFCNGQTATHVTGMIQSKGKMHFQPGDVLTVRARMPPEAGLWPIIWGLPIDWPNGLAQRYELDIAETYNGVIQNTAHLRDPGNPHGLQYRQTPAAANDGLWHTFVMDWSNPGVVVYYTDDQGTAAYEMPAEAQFPAFITINTYIADGGQGSIGGRMMVDYVQLQR